MSGMDVLRERIAQALWDRQQVMTSKKYPGFIVWRWDEIHDEQRAQLIAHADAVAEALELEEIIDDVSVPGRVWRRYVTPWERIEEDA